MGGHLGGARYGDSSEKTLNPALPKGFLFRFMANGWRIRAEKNGYMPLKGFPVVTF
jgi:hypothetical protein